MSEKEETQKIKKVAPEAVLPDFLTPHDPAQMDYTWFTLGPAYFMLGIPFDLLSAFIDTPEGDRAGNITCRVPSMFIPDIAGWENVVQGIQPDRWPAMYRYLMESGFYKKAEGDSVWSLYCTRMDISIGFQGTCPVNVFTPCGPEFHVEPVLATDGAIHFTKQEGGMDKRFSELASKV